jgi:hypothetical protein
MADVLVRHGQVVEHGEQALVLLIDGRNADLVRALPGGFA